MKWFILILFILAVNTNENNGQTKVVHYNRVTTTIKTITEPLDSLTGKLNKLSDDLMNIR